MPRTDAAPRVLLFGDPRGLPALLDAVPRECVVGLVGASIRPQQHEALAAIAEAAAAPLLIQPRASAAEFPDFLTALAALAPDVIVVYSYAMRLPASVLGLATQGAFNLHGALLPEYRGASPLQNAILREEGETGCTLHIMTPEFDDGDIVALRRVPLRFEDTWRDAYERLSQAAAELLLEQLPLILAGTYARTPQDPARAAYYKRRHPEDGLIDWALGVRHAYNLIRALVHPHPGAFYVRGENKIVLDRYHHLPEVAAIALAPDGGGRMLASGRLRLLPGSLPALAERLLMSHPGAPAPHDLWWQSLAARNDALAIALAPDDGPTGTLLLGGIDTATNRAVAMLGAPPEWPEAWLDDAWRLACRFAFDELKLQRLIAVPASDHERNSALRVGFVAHNDDLIAQSAPADAADGPAVVHLVTQSS